MPIDLTPEERARRGALWRADLDTLPVRVVAHAIERLGRWAVPLSPHTLLVPQHPAETDLAMTIADVIVYARTGRTSDWDDAASALDALQTLSILYDAPLRDDATPADWIDDSDHEGLRGELAEVARAAIARTHLERGEPVPRVRLAALAGVSVETIKKALRVAALATAKPKRGAVGRPARGDGGGRQALDVDCASARAWLAERGVAGVASEKRKTPRILARGPGHR